MDSKSGSPVCGAASCGAAGRAGRDLDDLIQEGFLRLCRYEQRQKAPVRNPVAFLVDVVEIVHVERVRRAVLTRGIFSTQPIEEVDFRDCASSAEQNAEAAPDLRQRALQIARASAADGAGADRLVSHRAGHRHARTGGALSELRHDAGLGASAKLLCGDVS